MTIDILHNQFVLHPSGAAFWEEKRLLLISDVHLGKIAHFRKHGIAVPSLAVEENFNRMDAVVAAANPTEIIFLGDLFHSTINYEWQLFASWRKKVNAKIVLVEGNHDIIDRQNYDDLHIAIHAELKIEGFLLTHHPVRAEGFFNICGHLHPGIKLNEVGRQSLKLACFFKNEQRLILPAFGAFTGKYFMRPENNDQVYAIANNEIIRII